MPTTPEVTIGNEPRSTQQAKSGITTDVIVTLVQMKSPKYEIFASSAFKIEVRLLFFSSIARRIMKEAGFTWTPSTMRWSIVILNAEKADRIRGVLNEIGELEAEARPKKWQVQHLFAIERAPDLGVPTEIDGIRVIFSDAGRMFKINAGHIRKDETLRPFLGRFACIFYGNFVQDIEVQ